MPSLAAAGAPFEASAYLWVPAERVFRPLRMTFEKARETVGIGGVVSRYEEINNHAVICRDSHGTPEQQFFPKTAFRTLRQKKNLDEVSISR